MSEDNADGRPLRTSNIYLRVDARNRIEAHAATSDLIEMEGEGGKAEEDGELAREFFRGSGRIVQTEWLKTTATHATSEPEELVARMAEE